MTCGDPAPSAEVSVELVFALPEVCQRLHLTLPAGATVSDALRHAAAQRRPESCWQAAFLDAALAEGRIGIYGEVVDGSRVLAARDRLELYRPLAVDPKTARRERAGRQRRSG